MAQTGQSSAVLARSRGRLIDWAVVLPVVALALSVRLWTLDDMSLWNDEIAQVTTYYSANYKEVMYRAARYGQPPLDYWIGYLLFKIDRSDFTARLPAAVFGSLTVLCAYFLGRRLAGRPAALLATVGLACSPHMVHYSQEARPYAIFWFTVVLSVLLLVRAWERNRLRDWLLFLPAVSCCLLTRSLGSLMVTTGMGLWALTDVWRCARVSGPSVARHLLRCRGGRLSICLVVAWAPALHILQFIIQRTRKGGYLAEAGELFDWRNNLGTLGQALQSVVTSAQPIGVIAIPLAVAGVAVALMAPATRRRLAGWVIFVPVTLGFAVHAVVYAFMVGETAPKYVYWGYVLPFAYLGAACAAQTLARRWRARGGAAWPLPACWVALVLGLLCQLLVDRREAIAYKPDWRAVTEVVGRHIDPARDVVFCGEAQAYGTAGMVFRVSPHFWDTDHHLVNVLRDQHKLFNDGRPILDRRDCRVALMLRCEPDLDGPALWSRLSPARRSRFEFHDFHQFLALISREPYATADHGLLELAETVSELLEGRPELGVHLAMGAAWVAAKRGQHARVLEIYQLSRELVHVAHRPVFDEVYGALAEQARHGRRVAGGEAPSGAGGR